MKLFKRVFIIILIIIFTLSVLILVNIYNASAAALPAKSDVIIVLGCRIMGDEPSLSLLYRLEKALELYNEGYGQYFIVTGGQGPNEIMAEALVMAQWFKDNGVDENSIIVEDKASSTYENMKYSRSIMTEKGFQTAVIVSNNFHIYRSVMLAKRVGISASACSAPSYNKLDLYYYIREIAAVCKSFILDR